VAVANLHRMRAASYSSLPRVSGTSSQTWMRKISTVHLGKRCLYLCMILLQPFANWTLVVPNEPNIDIDLAK
jgi:hypothetical protein